MAESIISSYFEDENGPMVGLSPTLRIWKLTSTGQELIVGTPCGSGQSSDGAMVEVTGCGSPEVSDGFYRFTFSDTIGYEQTGTYVVRIDAGGAVPANLRYQVSEIAESVTTIWDEPKADHLIVGSTGEALSQLKADSSTTLDKLYLDANSVLQVTQLLLKLQAGRTEIDIGNSTLTIYDENCTTPLRVFQLLNELGAPSVTNIIERKPILKGSGDNTTITDVCS